MAFYFKTNFKGSGTLWISLYKEIQNLVAAAKTLVKVVTISTRVSQDLLAQLKIQKRQLLLRVLSQLLKSRLLPLFSQSLLQWDAVL
jgi:hypothetical protein